MKSKGNITQMSVFKLSIYFKLYINFKQLLINVYTSMKSAPVQMSLYYKHISFPESLQMRQKIYFATFWLSLPQKKKYLLYLSREKVSHSRESVGWNCANSCVRLASDHCLFALTGLGWLMETK